MFAFLAAHNINISQKSVKRNVSSEMLVRFPDEIEIISEEERKRQAEETFRIHKEKFWMLLKHNEKGEVKKFDQEDYDRIMRELEN